MRQTVLERMLHALGYPRSLIAVEKHLGKLSPGHGTKKLLRRADIVVFTANLQPNHDLAPLLVLECKALPLTETAWQQVLGYNHVLGAPFIGIATGEAIRVGWQQPCGAYAHVNHLPAYRDLLASLLG